MEFVESIGLSLSFLSLFFFFFFFSFRQTCPRAEIMDRKDIQTNERRFVGAR